MRPFLLFKVFLFLLVINLISCRSISKDTDSLVGNSDRSDSATETTTVYFVRHAEKDISDPGNEDPDLTALGRIRAEALRTLLEDEKIDALYATKYIRTKNTLKPLADERQLEIVKYEGHDFEGLKQRILEKHAGKTVVVAGHSNTLLPLIEAFGAKKPLNDISESEYFYLFKVVVNGNRESTVEMSRYGQGAN